jgi:hypothetical protein
LESLGNNFGLGEDNEGGDVSVSLQEIIPIKKMKPSKYFMAKKYSFSCSPQKTYRTPTKIVAAAILVIRLSYWCGSMLF